MKEFHASHGQSGKTQSLLLLFVKPKSSNEASHNGDSADSVR